MWTALGKGIRDCLIGAIILAAAAIVVGGMTDTVPAAALESIAEFFRYAFLKALTLRTAAALTLLSVASSYAQYTGYPFGKGRAPPPPPVVTKG